MSVPEPTLTCSESEWVFVRCTQASAQSSACRNSRRGVPLPQMVILSALESLAPCALRISASMTWLEVRSKLSPGPWRLVGIAEMNSAPYCSGEEDRIGPNFGKPRLGVGLTFQIDRLAVDSENLAVLARQPADDRQADHAAVSGDPDTHALQREDRISRYCGVAHAPWQSGRRRPFRRTAPATWSRAPSRVCFLPWWDRRSATRPR